MIKNLGYLYQAEVLELVDGDTLDLMVDVGFNMRFESTFRLLGVDTHETHNRASEKENKKGEREKHFVRSWLADNGPLLIETHDMGSFGRWLVRVWSFERVVEWLRAGAVEEPPRSLNKTILDTFEDVDYE